MNSAAFQMRRYLAATAGSVAVELALVLPLLTVLVFGFIEVGRLYWTYHVAASSARDAARYAARLPVTCPGGGAGTFVTAGDGAKVQNVARTGQPTGGNPVIGGWTNNADVTVTINCIAGGASYLGRYEDMSWIPQVSVAATVPFNTSMSNLFPAITSFTVSNQQAWTE